MSQPIIDIQNLSRSFADKQALNDISLSVGPGEVLGIVGENGAGKTTLIKHILGMYQAQSGTVEVMGMDPVAEPEKVLAEIGYLSEEPDMPAWMKVSELLNYTSSFYRNWDQKYAHELVSAFKIDTNKKVKELSKGQKARVGLVTAQAHKPKLLLLDEPSSGLDPNVRRDILGSVIRTVADAGRTVIFSSHLLDEVERVCDKLIMIKDGEIILSDTVENVLNNHYRIVVSSISSDAPLTALSGYLTHQYNSNDVTIDIYGSLEDITAELAAVNIELLSHRLLSLSDIFISRTIPNQ
ncbi:MAG: ABC transporter ATP-binding protein [Kangiellaceae bacterium]|jgi:ABC-2 type transport system ATP-binding protein|nr:ABC transporter ATP-binding protein [Kangiellaceae bacterium]